MGGMKDQLTFPDYDYWGYSQQEEPVDEKFCSCSDKKEVKVTIMGEVIKVCKLSEKGCGKEIM